MNRADSLFTSDDRSHFGSGHCSSVAKLALYQRVAKLALCQHSNSHVSCSDASK